MSVDIRTRQKGLEFIVGEWKPDFIVNMFSDNLDRIPAAEFKSDDGTDLTAISFTFEENKRVKFADTSRGLEFKGRWEQTNKKLFRVDIPGFATVPNGFFDNFQFDLTQQNGELIIATGVFALVLKKTTAEIEGIVTKPDIGSAKPSESDLAMKEIVGRYEIYKALSVVSNSMGLFTRAEVEAEAKRLLEEGKIDKKDAEQLSQPFDFVIEFSDDHRVLSYMKVPANITKKKIQKALDNGEILSVVDGWALLNEKEWKAVGGKYYYNSGEYRELFGELQSPWDEIQIGSDGLLQYGKMMILKKIN